MLVLCMTCHCCCMAPAGMPAWPVGASGFGNEMSTAALHDPFAALTGLPPKNSPGAAGNRPSPPRPGTSVFPGF